MKLSEIFSQLTSGELSQVGVGGAEKGGVQDKDVDRLINLVNTGLQDLHSRFTIRKGCLTLALQPDVVSYALTSAFAVNGKRSKEPVRYIIDSPAEPFRDDLLKVDRVVTDAGYEMALNVDDDPESAHTPADTVLRLPRFMVSENPSDRPDYLKTVHLDVHYRAGPTHISTETGTSDPAQIEVALPRVYLQALLYFVASRVHAPLGMNQEFYTGSIFSQKYEQECNRLALSNVEIDTKTRNTRAERAGWV